MYYLDFCKASFSPQSVLGRFGERAFEWMMSKRRVGVRGNLTAQPSHYRWPLQQNRAEAE